MATTYSREYLQGLRALKRKQELMNTVKPYADEIVAKVLSTAESGHTKFEYNNPHIVRCVKRMSDLTLEDYLNEISSAVKQTFPDTIVTVDSLRGIIVCDWS
jgi:hypothetical protein